MRNIVNISKKNIIVSYDLKGSTFDREVLKDLKNYDDQFEAYRRKCTLKDSDFLKFERKIKEKPSSPNKRRKRGGFMYYPSKFASWNRIHPSSPAQN